MQETKITFKVNEVSICPIHGSKARVEAVIKRHNGTTLLTKILTPFDPLFEITEEDLK